VLRKQAEFDPQFRHRRISLCRFKVLTATCLSTDDRHLGCWAVETCSMHRQGVSEPLDFYRSSYVQSITTF
jgi:hypothetical protein